MLLLIPTVSGAQTAGDAIASAVKAGQKVSIVDDHGRTIEGRVDGISEETLRVSVRKATEEIPLNRIVRIDRPDSLRNGTFIGMGIGLASGLIGYGFNSNDGGSKPAIVAGAVVGHTLVWTAIGTAVDALFNHNETLYERGDRSRVQARVLPVLGGGTRGAAVSLTW
jgi:hypothetical protein